MSQALRWLAGAAGRSIAALVRSVVMLVVFIAVSGVIAAALWGIAAHAPLLFLLAVVALPLAVVVLRRLHR